MVEKRDSLYKLDLSNTIKVYPVLLVVLLFKDPDNALSKQVNEPSLPINIEGELEYEVEEILALEKKAANYSIERSGLDIKIPVNSSQYQTSRTH